MDTVFPAATSALRRGRRACPRAQRLRSRTTPVTFAEIKEVDEECDEAATQASATGSSAGAGGAGERRRRPDVLDERLGRQFAEFRRRRSRRDVLREPPEEGAGDAPANPEPPPAGPAGAADAR